MKTPEEIKAYNEEHSPRTLLRMGWSYYDTESSARSVAAWADWQFKELLSFANGMNPESALISIKRKLESILE